MPQWFTAFLGLVVMCALGVYMVHGMEGFTAKTACNTALASCQKACTDATCFKKCLDTNTKCLANAVAAQTVAITSNKQGSYINSNLAWAKAQDPSLGVSGLADGSSVPIPKYSSSIASLTAPSPSPSPSPSAQTWDANRTTYTSGWKQASPAPHADDSYEAIPVQASYTPSVKKWKPHDTPTQEPTGVTINAPTDAGTFASSVTPMPSLQQLIRKDAKDTVVAIFNEYEIQYS